MQTITETGSERLPLDVVVIDDEEMFTEGCRQTLEMGGYRAAVARDGLKGLDWSATLNRASCWSI